MGTNLGGRGFLGSGKGSEVTARPMRHRVLRGRMALYEDY